MLIAPGISAWPAVLFNVQKKLSAWNDDDYDDDYHDDDYQNDDDNDADYGDKITFGLESTVQEI